MPRQPGLLSAWGVAAADVVRDWGRTLRVVDPADRVLVDAFRALLRAARRELRRDGVSAANVERVLEVRYAGQSHEISVPYRTRWRASFHRAHARLFGHADVRRPVEVVTVRLRARGGRVALPPDPPPRRGGRGTVTARTVVFDGRARRAAVHRRDDLAPGRRVAGPAIVCEYSATTVVPPGWRLTVDRLGGLVLEGPRR